MFCGVQCVLDKYLAIAIPTSTIDKFILFYKLFIFVFGTQIKKGTSNPIVSFHRFTTLLSFSLLVYGSLLAWRTVDRITVGVWFSAPVQTGPGANPFFHTMGTGSFPGIKRPGRGVNYPPLSSVEIKERVELYRVLHKLKSYFKSICLFP
jgi:hypothetical protein